MTHDRIAVAFDGIEPEELPESVDDAAVRRIRRVAYFLDECIPIPGTGIRVGVDPILSVIPGAGDAVSAAISLYIVAESARLGASFTTLLRMLATVAIDALGGVVPVVGPVFDMMFKANKWNVELLLEELLPEGEFEGASEDESVFIEVT